MIINKSAIQKLKEKKETKYVELLEGLAFPLINDGYEVERRISKLDFKKYFKSFKMKDIPFRKLSGVMQKMLAETTAVEFDMHTPVKYMTFADQTDTYLVRKFELFRELAYRLCRLDLKEEVFYDDDIEKKNPITILKILQELQMIKGEDITTFVDTLYHTTQPDNLWEMIWRIDAIMADEDVDSYIASQKEIQQLWKMDETSRRLHFEMKTKIVSEMMKLDDIDETKNK